MPSNENTKQKKRKSIIVYICYWFYQTGQKFHSGFENTQTDCLANPIVQKYQLRSHISNSKGGKEQGKNLVNEDDKWIRKYKWIRSM